MKVVYLEKSQIEKEMAKVFIEKVKENPKCVLGLATGSSPLGIYKNTQKYNKSRLNQGVLWKTQESKSFQASQKKSACES